MNCRSSLSLSGLISGSTLIPFSLASRIRETCIGNRQPRGFKLGDSGFTEGDRPGSNLTYVEAAHLATLACLQHRLN
jgi:hypothetical protein